MIQANAQRARLIIDEFVRCGVNQFILSPGFRNAPLSLAAISHPFTKVTVHFDERGSAFFAVGYGRAKLSPCVWITTSGTAVANGMPAVVESSMDDIPLICLTADRPPELRDTASNQTIDQIRIFGDYPRWFADLPTPENNSYEPSIRSTIDYAVYRSRSGPVHLNCMFREPLLEMNDTHLSIPNIPCSSERQPQTRYKTLLSRSSTVETHLLERITRSRRGLIVAGRFQAQEDGEAIEELAMRVGWPLLADICAPVDHVKNCINFFDLIVRSPSFVQRHVPDTILQFGFPPVSKQLQEYLRNASAKTYVLISPSSIRIDPFRVVTDRIQSSIREFCDGILATVPEKIEDGTWMDAWKRADHTVMNVLSSELGKEISEPSVVWLLSDFLGQIGWIFGASSMPIRDLQAFLIRSQGSNVRVYANRGASGIDGTLGTVAGISHANPRRGVVLIGDLSMLHDINSLALLKESNVTIIVINNDGGGIFNMLPMALDSDVFEKVLGTPHGLNFRSAAEQFHIPYFCASSCAEFQESFRSAAISSGPTMIEVLTDRVQNATLHEFLFNHLSKAI